MLASLDWLRSLCPVDDDAERIAAVLTARGLTVDSIDSSTDQTVFEIDVPPNRPDCLGHLGLARELSAALATELRAPEILAPGDRSELSALIDVGIEDPDLCARYTARLVRGVRIGPSPDWVVRRLESCGLRSISNVVDASNLVLLELGNPIHFFDYALLSGPAIRVRRAAPGESLTTLDGVERKLDETMLVIADAERPVALAGIMGGANSEIGESSRDVLVEAAWFRPQSVRATARRLGLSTDASHRFERGVDPEAVIAAQQMAVQLLERLAGGEAVPGLIDVYPDPHSNGRLELRLKELDRLLGFRPEESTVVRSLESLGLTPEPTGDQSFAVTVPSWRVDLQREADLVEEVARHIGYEQIPLSTPGADAVEEIESQSTRDEEGARDYLSHHGFQEAFGYAMISAGEDSRFAADGDPAPLTLVNPIAESLAALRRSILPGLLQAVDRNHRRGVRDVRLFEVGRVFLGRGAGEFPVEPLRVGIAWSGSAVEPHWGTTPRDVDLFDVIGLVEPLLTRLRPRLEIARSAGARSAFHPGYSTSFTLLSGATIGWAGRLHPSEQRELAHEVYMAEIDLTVLADVPPRLAMYSAVPRLNAVSRDLALVLTPRTSYAEVHETLRGVSAPARSRIEAVDRYEGPPLAEDESSLTIRVTLQPSERTLTEDEIESYRAALVDALASQLGVGIRK